MRDMQNVLKIKNEILNIKMLHGILRESTIRHLTRILFKILVFGV